MRCDLSYDPLMKRMITPIVPSRPTAWNMFFALAAGACLVSCAKDVEKKPVGPVSETSPISWNTQVPGQGMGQFGMMPQNQYRR